jgi:FKBP-type peptidyl-prolyl cis-trans isomerase
LKFPSATPPESAAQGPGGVRFQIVRQGTGENPGQTDTIIGDFSVWNADGTLAESTWLEPKARLFSAATLGEPFRPMLATVKMGSLARFWIPRAALAGWRPEIWPDADLVVEYEPMKAFHTKITTLGGGATAAAGGAMTAPVRQVSRFPNPDAAGPPAGALRTPSQVPFLMLEPGNGPKPAKNARLDLNLTGWALEGLIPKQVMQLPSATTLDRAPKKLAEVLRLMSEGGTARVWLSAKDAKDIAPVAGDRELIVDVTLSKIE